MVWLFFFVTPSQTRQIAECDPGITAAAAAAGAASPKVGSFCKATVGSFFKANFVLKESCHKQCIHVSIQLLCAFATGIRVNLL